APDSEQSPQQRGETSQGQGQREPLSPRSPDGKWTAYVKENNVYARSGDSASEIQLCQDGKEGLAYGMLQWAPDSKTLVAFRIDRGDETGVYLTEPPRRKGDGPKPRTPPYPLPGNKLPSYELTLFDIATRKQTNPDVEPIDLGPPRLHWQPHGRSLTYQKT